MADTPKTRVDLIDRALFNLGIFVAGQAPSATQRQMVDDLVDGHFAELRVEEIVYVADYGTPSPPTGGSIPVEYFRSLGDTLAWAAAPSFSLAGDPSLKALDELGRETLRRLTKQPRTRRLLKSDPATRMQNRVTRGNFTSGT